MSDLESEIKELLSGHRLSPDQLHGLQHGESDADTVRSLQRMLANTQNALLRLSREISQLQARADGIEGAGRRAGSTAEPDEPAGNAGA